MNKMSEISERIINVIDFVGSNPNSFAKSLGYNRSQVIYDITNGKANPSYDFFNKLLNSEYSDLIDLKWLITGRGSISVPKNEISVVGESLSEYRVIPPGPCQQCNLRERLINSLEVTVKVLTERLEQFEHYNEQNARKTSRAHTK